MKTRRVRFSAGGTDSPALRDLAGLVSGDVTDRSCTLAERGAATDGYGGLAARSAIDIGLAVGMQGTS